MNAIKLSAAVPQETSPNKKQSTFTLLFINDIRPNIKRIITVTLASTLAKAHDESPAAFISRIFTRKSSFISCKTVMNKLAKNNMTNTGMKFLNILIRAFSSKVTLSVRCSMSSFVGCGIRVISHPKKDNNGNAKAPIKAGIQNSPIPKLFITNSPIDFAVPELTAILSPIRLANKSVTLRPSRKLKMTPHMHPNERPLKNKANTLKGRGNAPNNISDNSATATDEIINFSRFSFFNSDISLIPINFEMRYPDI